MPTKNEPQLHYEEVNIDTGLKGTPGRYRVHHIIILAGKITNCEGNLMQEAQDHQKYAPHFVPVNYNHATLLDRELLKQYPGIFCDNCKYFIQFTTQEV